MTESEESQLAAWRTTPLAESPRATVPELVAEHIAANPDGEAVTSGTDCLTYAELGARAGRIARWLRARVGADDRVVVYLDRGVHLASAVLGVLGSGAAYVPLDADNAAGRLQTALVEASAVITTLALVNDLPEEHPPVLAVDAIPDTPDTDTDPDSTGGVFPSVRPRNEDLACVVHTSGSSGRPKAVGITHGNLAAMHASWTQAYELSSADVHANITTFSFVVFQADVVRALCSGGRLVVVPREVVVQPDALYTLLIEESIGVAEFVPTALRPLLRHVVEADLPFAGLLRLVMVGSDRWLYAEHEELRRLCGPSTRVVHSFGLTECTVDSAMFDGADVPLRPGTLTPIGRPFPGVCLYVLDDELRPVPIGRTGTLHVGGIGVTRGYLNDREATERSFLPDPFADPPARMFCTGDAARHLKDGTLQFLGRQDGQVKVRGFRVDLGEVELALRGLDTVRDAAAVLAADGEDSRIAAFVVADGAARELPDQQLITLPDGREVVSINSNETLQYHQEIAVERLYSPDGMRARDGEVVLDVGANIGMFTLTAAVDAPDAEIHAFEPIPEVHDVLRENVRRMGANARVHRAALGRAPGWTEITTYPHSLGMSSRYADTEDERAVLSAIMSNQHSGSGHEADPDLDEVIAEWLEDRVEDTRTVVTEVRTLSDVIADEGLDRIDLLKIVAQKSEWDVLLGVAERDWPRIGRIVIEVYDIEGRVAAIRNLLHGKGFRTTVRQAPLFEGTNVHLLFATAERASDGAASRRPAAHVAAPSVTATDLRAGLRSTLPDYMVPATITFVDDLPTTSSGKIDREELRSCAPAVVRSASYVAPGTEIEKALAGIFAEILDVEQVGLDDDFFDLGGNSMAAGRVVTRARQRIGVDLPLRVFLRMRTIRELAGAAEQARAEQDRDIGGRS